MLLGIGLLGNAIAIVLIGITRQYDLLLLWAAVAGLAGTIFHPVASALIPAHYPGSPGMAIGFLGIGSGLGFFIGPKYAGWRAQAARWTWNWTTISQWQKPCIELGIAGLIAGILFLVIAKEADVEGSSGDDCRSRKSLRAVEPREPLGRSLSLRVAGIGALLGWRDFAGMGSISLAGIYLQKAHHFDTKNTGAVLGTMLLFSIVLNPLLVWLSPGFRRLPALRIILLAGGIFAAIVPFFPTYLALPALCAFQSCQAGSYAISDASLLERASPLVRGRIYGLYFALAGTIGSLGPWVMGIWTDTMRGGASAAANYILPFGVLGFGMIVAAFSTPLIAQLGPSIRSVDPMSEAMPATMEPAG